MAGNYNLMAKSLAWVGESATTLKERADALRSVYQQIAPENHTEKAFCVWAGNRLFCDSEHAQEVIATYCRQRKTGERSFPYSLLDTQIWKTPDTHGVAVFREQHWCLLREMTGMGGERAAKVVHDIYAGRIQDETIQEMICGRYLGLFTDSNMKRYIAALRRDYAASLPYYFCSTIADKF